MSLVSRITTRAEVVDAISLSMTGKFLPTHLGASQKQPLGQRVKEQELEVFVTNWERSLLPPMSGGKKKDAQPE
jgi:hypothetical protein